MTCIYLNIASYVLGAATIMTWGLIMSFRRNPVNLRIPFIRK